jgi:hypothetical protein
MEAMKKPKPPSPRSMCRRRGCIGRRGRRMSTGNLWRQIWQGGPDRCRLTRRLSRARPSLPHQLSLGLSYLSPTV